MNAKLKIGNETDRLAVASILVKNGYTVRQFGVKAPNGKRNVYFLEIYKDDNAKELDNES